MIVGTGIDMVNMERIERAINRWGRLFLHRVFTEREITGCETRIHPSECFAARFAAKEAWLKAIGWGLRNGIHWRDIEVQNDPLGRPFLSFYGKAGGVLDSLRVRRSFLTLSHERPYAMAHVLLEGSDDESCNGRTNAGSGSEGH